MRIFGAALSGDDRFLDDSRFSGLVTAHPDLQGLNLAGLPFEGSQMVAQGIPTIDPALTMINILNIREQGIAPNLRRWANANLRGRDLEIFNELWEAGNPLSFWSQVYDLRYVQMFWNFNANTDLSVITAGDIEYFRQFLRDGGGLYIQAAYANFVERNESTIRAINRLTRNNINAQWGQADEAVENFWFNPSIDAENFATDFNNLRTLQNTRPMRWVRAGGVSRQNLQRAIPLISNGGEQGRAVKVFWNSDGLAEYEPGIPKNGRIILSFSVSGFRDHNDASGGQGRTITSQTTLATVQNLYDLMSGTRRYTIAKSFDPEELKVSERGKVRIVVRNPNNYPFAIGKITDELSPCLRFESNLPSFFIDNENTNITPAQFNTNHNGQRLEWELNGLIPARSDWVIEFEFRVDNSNCNNN